MIVLIPLLLGLWGAWVLIPRIQAPGRRDRALLGAFVLSASFLIALVCVWAGYFFRYRASPEAAYGLPWDQFGDDEKLQGRIFLFIRHFKILPEAFAYGLRYVLHERHRTAFLNGGILQGGAS